MALNSILVPLIVSPKPVTVKPLSIVAMAERIQNNILAEDIVTQPIFFDSGPKLAFARLEAFEFFNIKPLS